jgi:hypothetical protein
VSRLADIALCQQLFRWFEFGHAPTWSSKRQWPMPLAKILKIEQSFCVFL